MTEKFRKIIAIMLANGEHLDLNIGVNGQYYIVLFDGTAIIWEIDDRPDKDDVYFYDCFDNKFSFKTPTKYYHHALNSEFQYWDEDSNPPR